jgi:hypothetical protein
MRFMAGRATAGLDHHYDFAMQKPAAYEARHGYRYFEFAIKA